VARHQLASSVAATPVFHLLDINISIYLNQKRLLQVAERIAELNLVTGLLANLTGLSRAQQTAWMADDLSAHEAMLVADACKHF
jgi:hypothetical protein